MTRPVVRLTAPDHDLAEGPRWDAAAQRVQWVDIEAGLVLSGRFSEELEDGLTDVRVVHRGDVAVGAAVRDVDGALVIAAEDAVWHLAADGDRRLCSGLAKSPSARLNDATCDAGGRLLTGSMSRTGPSTDERLLVVDGTGAARVLKDGVGLANGIAFSADNTTLFFVDSEPGIIWRAAYDATTGSADRWEIHLRVADGLPDGITVDSRDHLWVAVWGTGEVRRFTPVGELAETVYVDVPQVSSCALVGPDLDVLVITTARRGLTEEQLATAPGSGALFGTRVDVPGLPATVFSPSSRLL